MPKQNFEKAMKELEEIIQELEKGELPLEKAMKKFEEGVQLSNFCTETLDEAERKITVLLQDQGGTVSEQAFMLE
jgi:exodeoxyribonuclease VII small subunit